MLDPKYFRNNLEETAKKLAKRGVHLNVAKIQTLEEQRKVLQVNMQNLQNERNAKSKEIGKLKSQGQDASDLMTQVNNVNASMEKCDVDLAKVLQELNYIYHTTPNFPHESVPEGLSEENNMEVRKWGTPKTFAFTPQDHVTLGENLGMMDFALGAKLSGARFVTLSSGLAKMQRALTQFMLDVHTLEHGYTEVYVPYLVNDDSLFGTAQLPKLAEDLFRIPNDPTLSLIPTAEVPVTNIMRDVVMNAEQLPCKFVAHTPCFRSEAGSYGKDMRGMIRNHQFEKVELVRFERPENSFLALEELVSHAETILKKLELPFRTVALCGGDLGFASTKTYDLEVWLPSQNRYREISSCSNFVDFQARRMQARWKNPATNKPELVHTLNGSGLAVGRTLVAIMENYQDENGKIHIPAVLQNYMGGLKEIV